jgi:endo-1,4-beta-xylanase
VVDSLRNKFQGFVGFSCSVAALLVLPGCGSDSDGPAPEPTGTTTPEPSATDTTPVPMGPVALKEKFGDLFTIGAAIDPQSVTTHSALLLEHFNSVTTENEMKFDSLQRTEGVFTYAPADQLVNFARQNGMNVRGHALVWHRQTPAWMFSENGAPASAERVLERMRNHITNVVTHFKGSVQAWDVVNEAMMDDGQLRTAEEEREDQRSPWYGATGDSYIAEAFRAAHDADPDAKLFYNDYYNYIPVKHQAIYEMLRGLLAQGVPVHGVGLQGHLNIRPSTIETNQAYHQTPENMEAAIQLYASLGLEVHVTEMDLSVYIPGMMYTPDLFYTPETFTADVAEEQAARYRAFFDMFRRQAEAITNVTFWGVADDNTWLSEFSSGRQDFPLLFDRSHQKKQAFDAIVDF